MLILNNKDVESILTMDICIEALEETYQELARDNAVNVPQIRTMTPRKKEDFQSVTDEGNLPATDPVFYVLTTIIGALSKPAVTSVRIDSDAIHWPIVNGKMRKGRIPMASGGRYGGFVILFSSETSEPLILFPDGYMQKMKVAGTAALGTKYLARKDAETIGLIGSGWQAEAQVKAHCAVRDIKRVRVYSPRKERRENFAKETEEKMGIEVRPVDEPQGAVKGADIVVAATNSVDPVIQTKWLEEGMYLTMVKDFEFEYGVYERCDVLVVNSKAGPQWTRHVIGGVDQVPEHGRDYWKKGSIDSEKLPTIGEVMLGQVPGRSSDQQVTSLLNIGDGIQLAGVGYRIYELAKKNGLGKEIPTDYFLQGKEYIP